MIRRIWLSIAMIPLAIGLVFGFLFVVTSTAQANQPTGPADLSGRPILHLSAQQQNSSGGPLSCNAPAVTFDTGIPATWVTATTTGPVYWTLTGDLAGCDNPYQAGGIAPGACADSDTTNNPPSPYDTEMWSNAFDLSAWGKASLELQYRHRQLNNSVFDIDISTNGGASWTNLFSDTSGNPTGTSGDSLSLDLSAYLGSPNVMARFRYYGDAWDWYAQVDDVSLDCLAPGVPVIALEKTVGTNPFMCATENEISVPPGTDVTYCYEVFNTGTLTLTLHDLVDSEIGPILNSQPFTLTPGASAFLTQTANITQTTFNTATWTAYNAGPSDVVMASDSATVNIVTPAAFPACADFESGSLPSFMYAQITSSPPANGRVQVTGAFPNTGSFALDIDTDCDGCGGSTLQSGTMVIDLAGETNVFLDFWVHEHGDENNPEDGVFISDDGGSTWAQILSLNGFPSNYENVLLDLAAAASGAGMNLVDGFQIRFQSFDNFSIPTDGYSFDDICVQPEPDPEIDVSPSGLSSVQVPNSVTSQQLTISNLGGGFLNWTVEEAPDSVETVTPEYVAGLYAPSAGPAPADGVAVASSGPGGRNPLGSMVRSWNSQNGPYFTIFDLDTPENLPIVAPFPAGGNFVSAGEFVNGLSYMVDVANNVYEVDDSGAILNQYTATAPLSGQVYSGLALDPVSGDVFAASTSVATSTLMTFDVLSGNASVVGPILGSPGTIALAFDGAGKLFAYDIINDTFFQIDPGSGATSNSVALPFDANFGQGMGYDPLTGLLYLLAFNNGTFQPELWTVNTSHPASPVFNFAGVLGASVPGGLNQLSWGGTDIDVLGCGPDALPWVSVNPAGGSTVSGSSNQVQVTFDSTGLGSGTFNGNLCVLSNDPVTPVTLVPLTLTVGTAPSIEVAPATLAITLNSSTSGVLDLVITNTGELNLDWTIDETAPALASSYNAPIEEVVTDASQCAQYENYPGREPLGYAEVCLGGVAMGGSGAVAGFRDPTDTAFALDIGFVSDNFVSHVLNDFPGQTVLGANVRPIFAMDFDASGTLLYAIDNSSRELGTINLANGVFTPFAVVSGIPAADNISGLTIDPISGKAFVSGLEGSGALMTLYSMDLGTAVATAIGSDASVGLLIDIAIGPQGVIYGHDIGTDSIYTIDPNTGAATLVGPTGVNSSFAQGMDFDNEDGTLYAYTYQGGGANQYGTIDLATGALTPLAIDNPLGEFEGAVGGPPECTSLGDIPWVNVSPASGTTPGGMASTVQVSFDTSGLGLGVHTGSLCITSNDPMNPFVVVPLSMTVRQGHWMPTIFRK